MAQWDRTGQFLFRDNQKVACFDDWRIAELAALELELNGEKIAEIERLRAENERLREALMKIRDVVGTSTEAHLIARTALCDEQQEATKERP